MQVPFSDKIIRLNYIYLCMWFVLFANYEPLFWLYVGCEALNFYYGYRGPRDFVVFETQTKETV